MPASVPTGFFAVTLLVTTVLSLSSDEQALLQFATGLSNFEVRAFWHFNEKVFENPVRPQNCQLCTSRPWSTASMNYLAHVTAGRLPVTSLARLGKGQQHYVSY